MTMKVTVGLSRKVGQPNYGSAGASCHIDVELDQSLLDGDQRHLQERLRQALTVCRQVVERELAGDGPVQGVPQDRVGSPPDPSTRATRRPAPAAAGTDSSAIVEGAHSGGDSGSPRLATPAQVKALQAIAGQGRLSLAAELQRQYGLRQPQQLTLRQASQMIDRLKATLTPQPA